MRLSWSMTKKQKMPSKEQGISSLLADNGSTHCDDSGSPVVNLLPSPPSSNEAPFTLSPWGGVKGGLVETQNFYCHLFGTNKATPT